MSEEVRTLASNWLESLVQALRLAALPADEQIAALPDFVLVCDEIVLIYEDVWLLVPQLREAGVLTEAQHVALARLDDHHEEMSNASDGDRLWTTEALRRDDRWAMSRRLAREALRTLGRDGGQPSFASTAWIPGSRSK